MTEQVSSADKKNHKLVAIHLVPDDYVAFRQRCLVEGVSASAAFRELVRQVNAGERPFPLVKVCGK